MFPNMQLIYQANFFSELKFNEREIQNILVKVYRRILLSTII